MEQWLAQRLAPALLSLQKGHRLRRTELGELFCSDHGICTPNSLTSGGPGSNDVSLASRHIFRRCVDAFMAARGTPACGGANPNYYSGVGLDTAGAAAWAPPARQAPCAAAGAAVNDVAAAPAAAAEAATPAAAPAAALPPAWEWGDPAEAMLTHAKLLPAFRPAFEAFCGPLSLVTVADLNEIRESDLGQLTQEGEPGMALPLLQRRRFQALQCHLRERRTAEAAAAAAAGGGGG